MRLDNLMPGKHRLTVSGSNVMSASAEVEVIAGGVTAHEMTLRPAVYFMLHFHFATDPPIGHLAYVIRSKAGKVVREGTLTHGSFLTSPSKLIVLLEKGSFELEVKTKNGLQGKARLEVPRIVATKQEVVVRLK